MSNEFELDFNRSDRLGFPEVIYGASKPLPVLRDILQSYQEKGLNALATKVQAEKGQVLTQEFAGSHYDETSGAFLLKKIESDESESNGVAILSAGTSDLYVVNEAYYTLQFLGCHAARYNDIGIAGIHRLLGKVEELKKYKVLIVVAGFEGALPTAVGGLLPQPIIAVPASVGYGVSEGGQVALNTMLASCANGISVVNIDNGYGAAMAAYRILANAS
ncbi:nickel pincer cofactor biosynthesis protein LarB [Pelagicoccus mobilis]|uniref:Nickel pincer cofactor biosynthesis protein LarB n=1 Tax=Pelagicoccus mobilis TaxID=415221 RepID=A0A934S1D3_9BACT|nr:nickel pincer cofactor biosynthesis protein LarB [Pelagicoccus mobilis]MBK1878806.1 nickel pincer cofactor biosynthesis protein LarB [Pelagicoccus mobilis]